jgi:hypothetical protein
MTALQIVFSRTDHGGTKLILVTYMVKVLAPWIRTMRCPNERLANHN